MNVGIVGQRKFRNMGLVDEFIKTLPPDAMIVTGGAEGVDEAAACGARKNRLKLRVFLPKVAGCRQRFEYTKAYYDRNQQIVDASDVLYAFTDKPSGGTWDTVKRAKKKGIPVYVFDAESTLETIRKQTHKEEATDQLTLFGGETGPEETDRRTPPAIYHAKLAAPGVFACRSRRKMKYEAYADIVQKKDACSPELVSWITEDLATIYESLHGYGYLDLLTMPPRSKRHLERQHPMDAVLAELSARTGVPYRQVFHPWDKKGRGAGASRKNHEPACLSVPEGEIRRKVILVCDDVCTTGRTMSESLALLLAAGAHARGLVWLLI